MRLSTFARSLALSTVVLCLSACETGGPARRLDDTSVPLMKPGYGLVATTLIERSRLYRTDQPIAVMSVGTTMAFYSPVRGSDGSAFVVQPRGETRASWVNPDQPGKADRGYMAFLTPVKPGKYYLNTLLVGPMSHQESVRPKKEEPVFEVREGEVTYAGSVQMLTLAELSRGGYEPVRKSVEVVDEYAKDMALIRAKEPRLSTVTIRNGLARQAVSN